MHENLRVLLHKGDDLSPLVIIIWSAVILKVTATTTTTVGIVDLLDYLEGLVHIDKRMMRWLFLLILWDVVPSWRRELSLVVRDLVLVTMMIRAVRIWEIVISCCRLIKNHRFTEISKEGGLLYFFPIARLGGESFSLRGCVLNSLSLRSLAKGRLNGFPQSGIFSCIESQEFLPKGIATSRSIIGNDYWSSRVSLDWEIRSA